MLAEDVCKECGFPKSLPREPVFMKKNILDYVSYQEDKCKGCGHQKSGWTIKSVREHYDPFFTKKNKELTSLRNTIEVLQDKNAMSSIVKGLKEEVTSLRKKLDAYEKVKVMIGNKEYSLTEAYKKFLDKLTTEMDMNTELRKKVKDLEEENRGLRAFAEIHGVTKGEKQQVEDVTHNTGKVNKDG